MSDVVERLRAEARLFRGEPDCVGPTVVLMVEEAADEITRLRAENEKLRAALGDVHASAKDNHLIANIACAALEGK